MSAPAAESLESWWAGAGGDAYTERNWDSGGLRAPFWQRILTFCGGEGVAPQTALEVGCHVASNLRHLLALGVPRCIGVDLHAGALAWASVMDAFAQHRRQQSVYRPRLLQLVLGNARALPVQDQAIDLVLSGGILTCLPPGDMDAALAELVRVSAHWLILTEYEADEEEWIAWRGRTDAVWKRPYTELVRSAYPELILRQRGQVGREDGFDNCGFSIWQWPYGTRSRGLGGLNGVAARLVAPALPAAAQMAIRTGGRAAASLLVDGPPA